MAKQWKPIYETMAQSAKRHGVTVPSIYYLKKHGHIEVMKRGRRNWIVCKSVDAYYDRKQEKKTKKVTGTKAESKHAIVFITTKELMKTLSQVLR